MVHPFSFVCVVWGKRFVEQFLEVCLPSFLASGNLGAFGVGTGDSFTLYTSAHDFATIKSHPAFIALEKQIPTTLNTFEDTVAENSNRAAYWDSWKVVNYLFSLHISDAIRRNAALCMLQPDSVWSDGSFTRFRERVQEGKKVLVVFSCHTDPGGIVPLLLSHKKEGEVALSIPPRPLVRYALENFHEYSSCHYYTASRFWNPGPGNFYWPVEGEGLMGHSFAGCNQVMVFPEDPPPWPITVGFELADYIDQICDRDSVYVFEDSDELMSIGLEAAVRGDPDYKLSEEGMIRPASPLRVADWISRGTRPYNRFIGEKVLRWRYADSTPAWTEVERERERIMQMILDATTLFDKHPALASDLRYYVAEADRPHAGAAKENASLSALLGNVGATGELNETGVYVLNEMLLKEDLQHHRPVDQYLLRLTRCIRANPDSAPTLIKETIEVLGSQGRIDDAMNVATACLELYKSA